MKRTSKISLAAIASLTAFFAVSHIASATILTNTTPASNAAPKAGAVNPASVYSGCSIPKPISSGHVYYLDPVNGKLTGDGSSLRPWPGLSAVINASMFANMPTHFDNATHTMIKNNPAAPIKAGDTLYLLSGNHGVATIQGEYGGPLIGYDNSDFITIAAAPGATPVIQQLKIIGAAKFIFQYLTFEGINTTGIFATTSNSNPDYDLVSIRNGQDIIFDHNTLLSQANVNSWSIADWESKRASGIGDNSSTCLTITNNTLKNIGFGITTQRSDNVLISGNTINYFSDDGIDYGSDNMLIENNTITNSVEDGDGFHRDGMQGQPYSEQTVVSNVVIKNNTVIRLTDPTLPYPGSLQGIDTFDGIWDNVTVTGNQVITNSWQGIAYYGANNITISNNILLQDSGKVLPCYGLSLAQCQTKTVIYDTSSTPWVTVHASKAGVDSTGVTISNNMVSSLEYGGTGTIENNTCISEVVGGAVKCPVGLLVNGKVEYYGKPGKYADNTVITSQTADQIFKIYDPVHMIYNLSLGSAATPYSGTVSIVANARQIAGQKPPELIMSVDGKPVGTATVTASVGAGQVGTYSFNFAVPQHPTTLTLTLNGYTNTAQKYVSLNVFNVVFGAEGVRGKELQTTKGGIAFSADGSTVQYNVTGD